MRFTGLIFFVITLVYIHNCFANNDLPKRDEKKTKSVTSFVSAKWEATPIVLELAEYLSGESSDLFWSFVDKINSLKSSLESLGKKIQLDMKKHVYFCVENLLYLMNMFSETDKEVYDACIGVASTLLAPAQLRMAKLALSMHLTSPTVRMFDQISTQNGAKSVKCDTFVFIASRKVCDNDALRDILKTYNQYDPVSIDKLKAQKIFHFRQVASCC